VVLDHDPVFASSIGQHDLTGTPAGRLQSELGLLAATDPKSFRIEIGMIIERVDIDSVVQSKRTIGDNGREAQTPGSKAQLGSRRFAPDMKVSERDPSCESTLDAGRGEASLTVTQAQ
jgi:hypothetical protein